MVPDLPATGHDPGTAERIASLGRELLQRRLRDALEQQARLEGVTIGAEDAERLVADGCGRAGAPLWHLSLIEATATELGIPLPQALGHPEVARAQRLAGAPPYLASHAAPPPSAPRSQTATVTPPPTALSAPSVAVPPPSVAVPPPSVAVPATSVAVPPPSVAVPPAAAVPPPSVAVSPPAAAVSPPPAAVTPAPGILPSVSAPEPPPATLTPHAEAVRVAAVHVGGLEAVRAGERDLELRFSPAGLDVLKRSSGTPIGRLRWDQIRSVELPRRRRGLRAFRGAPELHVETENGRASFELPGVSEQDLDEHLTPLLERSRTSG